MVPVDPDREVKSISFFLLYQNQRVDVNVDPDML